MLKNHKVGNHTFDIFVHIGEKCFFGYDGNNQPIYLTVTKFETHDRMESFKGFLELGFDRKFLPPGAKSPRDQWVFEPNGTIKGHSTRILSIIHSDGTQSKNDGTNPYFLYKKVPDVNEVPQVIIQRATVPDVVPVIASNANQPVEQDNLPASEILKIISNGNTRPPSEVLKIIARGNTLPLATDETNIDTLFASLIKSLDSIMQEMRNSNRTNEAVLQELKKSTTTIESYVNAYNKIATDIAEFKNWKNMVDTSLVPMVNNHEQLLKNRKKQPE